jgi:hypothetical protein
VPQCQFLFSAVSGFRKVTFGRFSELDETKAQYLIFLRRTQRSEYETERGLGLAAP